MANNEKSVDETKSNSQLKREERKKEVKSARRKARTLKIIGFAVLAVIVALIAWGVSVMIVKQTNKVQQSDDYSAGLDANGYISGVTASSKVTLPEYKGIQVPLSEVEYSDENVEADIETTLSSHQELSDDSALTVQDGDKVNIDYTGKIDGEEFDGGSSEAYDLTIGSDTFIDGFEDQLIGMQNGTTADINVTFPDDYSTEDLAGKDAVFTVTINGIYENPEFTDEFVQENLSEYASTAEGYRQYLKDKNYASNLKTYVENYLKDNTTVKSYPSKYVKILKSIQKYDDMQSYEYMNQMYEQYLGYTYYNSFEDYEGMTEEEYDASLKDTARETCKENMIYQAIVELEGATADADYYKAYLAEQGDDESYYDSQVETAGEPYVLQQAIKQKALEIAVDNAVVE